nr:response regulator [Desulfobacteraceae bacterium]
CAILGFIILVPILTFWQAFSCKGKERWIVLLLGASTLLGSLVPGIFNLLSREGIVDRDAFHMTWVLFTMAGFFLLIMLYVNNAKEKISFVGKLITVTAITILAILHFISHYSMKDRDLTYDALHVKDALLATTSRFIPGDMAYKAAFTLDRGNIAEIPGNGTLPVDVTAVKRQLYNTVMVENIRKLPQTGFSQHLENLLAQTPPHFEGYKNALLDYAHSLNPPGEATEREISAVLDRLNHLTFVASNKINQLPEAGFRTSLTAYLKNENDKAFTPFKMAIEYRLNADTQNGAALKSDILACLLPLTGQGERIYRVSKTGGSHYIAFDMADLNAGKFSEVGFHYRNYREYMHDAVFKFVVMILILILLSRYGFYWFFYGLLVKPLKALTKGVIAVETGDLDVSVPVFAEDEIGYITHAFNSMVVSIREAERKLQHDADNLLAAHTSLEASHREIRLLQHYLSNIIESMPSVLISIDENAKVTQWNAAAEKLTGIRATEILGKKLWDIQASFHGLEPYYHDVITSKKPLLFTREQLERTVDGEKKYYNISLYPLVANGISGAVLRIDDITEMEKMEQQLRQAQKMDTIGALAGGLAHDFNNILGGIVGTLSLLKYKLAKGVPLPPDAVREYIDTMERAGNRAADMVQQLLTLSRKQEMSFAPVDLNLILKHVVKICENTFDKSIEIKTVTADGYPMVIADPGQLEQVLLNLCVNAAHAMTLMRPEGERRGGVMTISIGGIAADKFFCAGHPEARPGETYWALSVQDTGIGMDTKTIAKIFDPFFTTKVKGKGTGLGLAMVYNIIQQHKGFIDVYSEKGIGSTFSIYLPRLEGSRESSLEKQQKSLPTGEGVVLVIDDEEIMREMAKNILTECGYTVMLAENGRDGVEIFKKERARIVMVMLDMVMPKISGRETFIAIQQVDPGVKVLLTSGFGKSEEIDALLNLGVMDFIQKPFTLEDLAKKTSGIVHQKR